MLAPIENNVFICWYLSLLFTTIEGHYL